MINMEMTNVTPVGTEWMFKTEYNVSEDTVRLDVVKWIDKSELDKFSILDVGCSSGKTLKYLRGKYPYAKLFGLEPDSRLVEMAREVCEVFECTIEEFIQEDFSDSVLYSFRTGDAFDYILFGDVLEHLKEPWIVLRDITKFLKPGGTIICSIPNIAFIEVIYNLLSGRFCYGTGGIIGKAHIRFFTLYEIVEMFEVCGYKDICYSKNNVNLTNELISFIGKLETLFGKSDMQHYDAYQYIVKARKD